MSHVLHRWLLPLALLVTMVGTPPVLADKDDVAATVEVSWARS